MQSQLLTPCSGIGLGICQRLIDEFLITRSLTSHLVLIPTTRSAKKAQDTIDGLRNYARAAAETSSALRSRASSDYNPRDTTRRIHVASVQLDLCKLPSVYRAADQLINDTLSSPSDDDAFVSLVDVRIPRLDSIVLNAGTGCFTGIHWGRVVHNILTRGIVSAVTWPTFKCASTGTTVDPISSSEDDDSSGGRPRLGEVFCGNVFGHYMFSHALLPLLSRPTDSSIPPGRIVWESSIEPQWDDLDLDDFQGLRKNTAYESSKRLTDVLALTCTLPPTRSYVDAYLGTGRATRRAPAANRPKIYLVHPGVVHTKLFPLNAFLFFWYGVILYTARLLGSPWHPITTYNGAVAPVWLVLQGQEALDANNAELVKWGSSTTWGGEARVKMSEVAPYSTSRPRYSTATRSTRWFTTAMS